jgi:sec-independent protein translocase protein TatB
VFNISGSEIVIILLLALIVLGPEKLPEAIRRFGRVYAELRDMSRGFQNEVRSAFDEPMRELRETADLTRRAVTDPLRDEPRRADQVVPQPLASPAEPVPAAEDVAADRASEVDSASATEAPRDEAGPA